MKKLITVLGCCSLFLVAIPLFAQSCALREPVIRNGNDAILITRYDNCLEVTATAYTSHVSQTDSTPNIAAWGDRLKPGMKAIAVSRDLLKVYGLKHRQKVRIKGLKGEYVVLDKMNKRWREKIDIYMGKDKSKAFEWGRRPVRILWDDSHEEGA